MEVIIYTVSFPKIVSSILKSRVFRFLFAGFLNTLFGYSVYSVAILLGIHYTIAMLLATCIGVLFNFFTIGHLVFKKIKLIMFFRYVAMYVGIYLGNIALIRFFVFFDINLFLSGLGSMLIMAFISYFLCSRFVYLD